jgi:thioredoxin-like negative regulator of GroEL
MNPTAQESYRVLGLTLAEQGQWAEAERVVRESLTLPGTGTYTLATLGYVLARTGRREEAEAVLATLEAQGARDYVSPVALITVWLGLEQWDRALEWAERARAERRGWLVYLKVNPLVDPLRGHPRFRALLEKMRL